MVNSNGNDGNGGSPHYVWGRCRQAQPRQKDGCIMDQRFEIPAAGVRMQMDDHDIFEIQGWLRQAGEIALDSLSTIKFSFKSDHSPVTDVEYRIESLFQEKIGRKFPSHQILTEEQGTASGTGDYLWALDPIDGTKSFLRGLPSWGISLGLLHRTKPIAGFFYVPAVNEMFWGTGGGAFLNGKPLPHRITLEESLTFMAVPANSHIRYQIDYPRLQAFGSTALHLSYLARGVAAGVLTRRVNLWDIAGFLPILQYLGIKYQYLSGRPVDITALLNGQKTPEPLLAAHPDMISTIQNMIHLRASS